MALLVWAIVPFTLAHAQTFNVLHNFSGGGDGGTPSAGLTIGGGSFYGTTMSGSSGNGTVFKLSHMGSGWVVNTLYTFQGGSDGSAPIARVLFGPDGALYGTTSLGGFQGNGTVFQLRPPGYSLQVSKLPVDGNRALSLPGRQRRKQPAIRRSHVR